MEAKTQPEQSTPEPEVDQEAAYLAAGELLTPGNRKFSSLSNKELLVVRNAASATPEMRRAAEIRLAGVK